MVVSDTGPLHYLLLAGAEEPLRILYGRVLVPQTVATELRHQNTPATVQAWIARLPHWCEIVPEPPYDPSLQSLDPGEHAAIALAVLAQAHRVLIEEQAGRAVAQQRSLLVTGL